MNPITKAHLEGKENFKQYFQANLLDGDDIDNCGKAMLDAKDVLETLTTFLTTYAEMILNAALEAGPERIGHERHIKKDKTWCLYCGHNNCLSSFRQAIDEGIKEIKKSLT